MFAETTTCGATNSNQKTGRPKAKIEKSRMSGRSPSRSEASPLETLGLSDHSILVNAVVLWVVGKGTGVEIDMWARHIFKLQSIQSIVSTAMVL